MAAAAGGTPEVPVIDRTTFRYFPFHYSQAIVEPIKCDDEGTLLMFELDFAVFQCGARAWTDLLMLEDRMRMVRLWMFLLQMACDCNAVVAIETVVNGHDYKTLHDSKLTSDTTVTGYRLWIPLDAASEVAFLTCVSNALATKTSVEKMDSRDTGWFKRRKIDINEAPLPMYAQPLETIEELSSLIRLYYMGISTLDVSMLGSDSVTDDGVEVEGRTRAVLSRLLSASAQFEHSAFRERCAEHGVLEEQTVYDNYVTRLDGSYTRAFMPCEALRTSGLVRSFRCGTCESTFLRNAPDILGFLLPQYEPTVEEIRSKLESVFSARGTVMDLEGLPIKELIRISNNVECADAICQDPHYYSPVTVPKDLAIEDCADSFYTTAMHKQYHVMHSLHARNTKRRLHASRSGDSVTVLRIYRETYRDISMLYGAPKMDGVPPVYNDLAMATKHLLGYMHGPALTNECKFAQHYFKTPPPSDRYRGFSGMLSRLTIGARNNLGLVDHQHSIWLLLYLMHFLVTVNRMGESFFGVLTGPPDTGKSRAIEVFAGCIPSTLVMQVDGASALAMTVYGAEHDMRVMLMDELKNITDKYGSGGNDIQTKLAQSQISNGCITYNVKARDATTGRYVLDRTVVVLRNHTVTCTNFRHLMAPALESRATTFAVPSTKKSRKKSKFVSRNASVVTRDTVQVKMYFNSWSKCLQTYSALQWRYTGMEAAGMIPPMDDMLFVVFSLMMFADLGDIVTRRRIVAMKKFAEAVRVFDLINTWHTRGLGAVFDFDPAIEVMYYASASYITGECIVAAFSLMEQTTSTSVQLDHMLSTLKETIHMDHSSPSVAGEYYVSRYNKSDVLLKHLKKFMQEEGEGMVEKLWAVAEAGLSDDGLPNIKFEKHDGTEKFMYHRTWMANIMSATETAILKVLRRLRKAKRHCGPAYDHEDTVIVFDSSVLVSLYEVENPEHSMKHPELDHKTKTQIQQAIIFLNDIRDDSGAPKFDTPAYYNQARYVVPTGENGAIPSATRDGEYKIRKELLSPLVVSVDLLEVAESATDTVDGFMKRFLAVCGGYADGRRIFAGVDPRDTAVHNLPDHTIVVPPDLTVHTVVHNKFYRSMACDAMMLGPDADAADLLNDTASEADTVLQNMIFPPREEMVEFTHESGIEALVAARALERIAPPAAYHDAFLQASSRY